jgi:phosphate starvation-inducible protein PhoH and related proteins
VKRAKKKPVRKTTKRTDKKRNKPRHNFDVKAKTPGQQKYIDSVANNTVTLCSGPAGSGKTLIATGMAMKFFLENEGINRVLIVRPAIEACGESLGYLPGDLDDKMRPFAEPIFDNLRFFIKDEGYITTLLAEKRIQISPMSHMRGRTFNNCVVIFDEAQNATKEQMKLFLTRLGYNCRAIVEGDITQSDIPGMRNENNGLADAMKRLTRCPGVGVVKLAPKDIFRSQIVADILKRYD